MVEDLAKDYHEALVDAFSKLSIRCGKTGKIYSIPVPGIMLADVSYVHIAYQNYTVAF